MSSKTKTTNKSEDGKPALTPKLRFPEFREVEGWEYIQLGNLLMSSPDYGVNAAAVPYSNQLPKYLRITDISEDGLYLNDKMVSVDLEPTDVNYLDDGDIVLARTGASVGKSYRYRKEDGELVFAGFLIRVNPDESRLVSCYLANYLTTGQYWDWVAVTSARSGQPGINSTEYSQLAIPLPPDIPEQQKIADCLSSVGEVIAAQAQKLDTLKTHKKGLMQQLFPREGETQPRLRFPEFQDAGEWETVMLGSIAKFTSGGTPAKNEASYWNGSIPWISASSMHSHLVEDSKLRVTASAIGNGTRIAKKGSILILVRGSMLFKRVPICLVLKDVAFNQDVKSISLKDDIDTVFLLYQLIAFESRFSINRTGIGAGKIDTEDLKSLDLFVPSPAEQQRIASCLTSLNDLIIALTQKLESLKTHKKGLMQQLFPSPESNL